MEPRKLVNVLVVDDSAVAQMLIVHILNSDPQINVLGVANSGERALEFLTRRKPDAIVMDLHMPGIDGFDTTRRIMETLPTPIVICSGSCNPLEVATTFRALEAGALAIVAKPVGISHPEFEIMATKLTETVKLMSEVKVVRRWPKSQVVNSDANAGTGNATVSETKRAGCHPIKIVAIGASTGGPPALQAILAGLPKRFPVPLLIVQHIAAGFLNGLVEWLSQTTKFPVQIAKHGETLSPGVAYFAPDGYHMALTSNFRISLSGHEPENGLRPAVSHLFRTVAAACGQNAVAILLTGMGKDGAAELKLLRDMGATTIAQSEASSVVHGMPGEAMRIGAATYVLAPEAIAHVLAAVVPKPV